VAGAVKRQIFNTGKGLSVLQSGSYYGIFLLCQRLAAKEGCLLCYFDWLSQEQEECGRTLWKWSAKQTTPALHEGAFCI